MTSEEVPLAFQDSHTGSEHVIQRATSGSLRVCCLTELSCSVTLEKKEPFFGKTILVGQPPKKKKKKGATEQLTEAEGKPKPSERTFPLKSARVMRIKLCLEHLQAEPHCASNKSKRLKLLCATNHGQSMRPWNLIDLCVLCMCLFVEPYKVTRKSLPILGTI